MTLAYQSSSTGPRWRDRLRSVLRVDGAGTVRVIIYGEHSPDWMAALGPDAPVWSRMPNVGDVVVVPDHPVARIATRLRWSARTVVIPLMETHTRHRPRRYASLVPDDRALRILSDKAAFADYLSQIGRSNLAPRTFANHADATYPCVLKRVDLNGGHGVVVVHSREELAARLNDDMWRGRPFVLQSYIPGGPEYVAHCVARNGRVLWHRAYAYEVDPRVAIRTPGNTGASHPAPLAPCHLAQIESLLLPLAYSGPCNIDYKLSDTGDIVVFEINPRLGGSLMQPDKIDDLHAALSCIIGEAMEG
jgi:predicted ATP-grasp superfamily ATP-dependent carboligase